MIAVLLLILSLVASLFLILIILIQRGKGGGLAGAFGGMGGQSAFGAKAGPITTVTIYVAIAWFVLCAVSVRYFNQPDTTLDDTLGGDAFTDTTPGIESPPGQATPPPTQGGATSDAPSGAGTGTPDASSPAAGDDAPPQDAPE